MRILNIFFIFVGILSNATAQNFFTIDNIHLSDNEYFTDIQYSNSRYYALSTTIEKSEPFRTLNILFIFDHSGRLIGNTQVGEYDYQYFRILSIHNNKVKLIGRIKTDSCTSILTLSEYNIGTNTLTHLAQYNFCEEKYIHSIRVVSGLDDKTFYEVVYSNDKLNQSDYGHRTYIMTLDELNNFSILLDLGGWNRHLSVDFGGKGYILSDAFVYEYYDRNFNHRYQYNNGGSGFAFDQYSSHLPLVNHYVLEQVITRDDDYHESEAIRLIDSNLHTKKLALINPLPELKGKTDLPVFGGLAIASYNSIWATGIFGNEYEGNSNYYSITRLDSDLKIVCTHFIGFDGLYRIFGITAFEDNGAIVYGSKMPYGTNEETGNKDLFALKVGNDCELLTTATNGTQSSIFSVSVYPNPGINDLTFSINGFDPATLRLELINEVGQILFNERDLTNSIQLPELSAGQYFYRILQEDRLLGVGSWAKQ